MVYSAGNFCVQRSCPPMGVVDSDVGGPGARRPRRGGGAVE